MHTYTYIVKCRGQNHVFMGCYLIGVMDTHGVFTSGTHTTLDIYE